MESKAGGSPSAGSEPDAWDRGGTAALTMFQKRSVDRFRDESPTALGEDDRPEADELKATFFYYLRVVLKRRWVIAAVATAIVLVGLILTLNSTSMYTASTTLQIDRDVAKVVEKNEDLLPTGGDAEFYQTQYELLKSRSLAERVVAALNLTEDLRLFGERKPGILSRFWAGLRGTSAATSSRGDLSVRQRAATSFVVGGLKVEPVRMSRLVRLSFTSSDPQLSQQIANAVSDNFIAANLERRFDASSYARTFLEERLQQLKAKLEESDQQVVAYAEKEQIVNLDDKETLVGSNLAAVNAKLGAVRNERTRNEQLWRQAEAAEGLALPQILESSVIQRLRDSRAQLVGDYQQRLNLFKPDYPEMQDIQARIDELDSQVQSEVQNIKGSLKAQYEASLNEERALTRQLEELKAQILNLRARTVQYDILQREVDTNRSLYDGLLQRYKEIGVAGGVGTNNVSVVDKAEIPTFRSSPGLRKNLQLALILGLMCGLACAFGLEFLDDTLNVPEEVEAKLGLPVLGVIPKFPHDGVAAELLENPRSTISEAYRSLCTALQFSTDDGVPKTLLITSARPMEGKTTTALTLARNFAKLGARVLLVDADLRNPSLNKILGLGSGAGLSNYLAGAMRPPEVLQATDHPNLTLLPSGPLPPNPAELLAGPRMLALLTVGSEVYDFVVIDGPPVMGLADAPLLASMAAGTLLVTAAGETRQGMVKQSVKRLQFARARVIGVLLSKFDSRRAGYTYGYGYGYGYGEDSYGYGNDQAKLTETKQAEAAE